MKRFLFFAFSLFLSTGLIAQNDVTFTVDMNDYTGTFTTVYVSGAFNAWSGNSNPMDDSDGDGVWTAIIPLMDGAQEFKYTLDDWADQEGLTPGDPCILTTGNYSNRLVTVAGAPVDLGTVCWNSCDACGGGTSVDGNITFSVDMNDYTGPTFTTVYVDGTFNGWSGSDNPLDDSDGDGVWTATYLIGAGDYEYKFTIDGWADQEDFPGGESCTITTGNYTNRTLSVNGDADLPMVCWNSCDPCGAAVDGNVTFSVDMNDYTGPTPGTVYVSGTFNGWAGDANALDDSDGDGVWTGTIAIPAGDIEYKFTIDNWAAQEDFPGGESCTVTNGGYTNRALSVNGDTDLPVVCWDSCDPCGASVGSNITFSVDMNEYADPFTAVYLSGTFNGWSGDANLMDDSDGDGVWETTIEIDQGTHEYKFQVDQWTAQENFVGGEACTVTNGGYTNRALEVVDDAVLETVCWNSCVACGVVVDMVSVTFNVNMSEFTLEPGGVFIGGGSGFGGPTDNPMDDSDGDGVYSITFMVPEGFSSHYTFLNGDCGWDCKEDIGGQDCADPGNFNDRFLPAVTQDTVLNTCFQECTPDLDCAPVNQNMVTFSVDMNDYTGTYTTVFLSGSFNGWGGNTNPMDDGDGDGVWETTIELVDGDYEYKFQVDEWNDEEVFAGGESCTITTGNYVNRIVTVAGSATLPTVCWNSCESCEDVGVYSPYGNDLFRLAPSITGGAPVNLFFDEPSSENRMVRVTNTVGQVVYEATISSFDTVHSIESTELANGMYIVMVEVGKQQALQKFIVSK